MEERIVSQFGGITLTNLRIRQRYTKMVKSALLGNVDGVAVVYREYPIWLVLAALALLGGIGGAAAEEEGGLFVVGLIFTAVFVGLYFATRQVALIVYAGTMQIVEVLKGIPMEPATEFVDTVESAQMGARPPAV